MITPTLVSKPSVKATQAIGIAPDQLGEMGVSDKFLAGQGFEAKAGQTLALPGGKGAADRLFIGLGGDDRTLDDIREAASKAITVAAKRSKLVVRMISEAATDGITKEAAAQAVAEGIVLGSYRFTVFKSEPKPVKLTKVTVQGSGAKLTAGFARGIAIGEAVNFARDLVNRPGGDLVPAALADEAVAMAAAKGLECRVMGKTEIIEARMGGILGVNRGSTHEPRFIEIIYAPRKPKWSVALVGKGITFDSGGLSIKSGAGMMTMKCDMGGAAAVIGAMAAIAETKPAGRVTAYVAASDNMLGGDATRPGDVLTFRNGKTAEVLNTDAEGRLVLADALSYASEQEPDAIIDVATLTGACMVALGTDIAGVMGNNDDLVAQLEDASDSCGELVWELPLPKRYRKLLDSSVADMKNIGGPYAGSLTAGLFLSEFVADDIAWAHIDIAGPGFRDSPSPIGPKGGTGFGVRLLTELLEHFEVAA